MTKTYQLESQELLNTHYTTGLRLLRDFPDETNLEVDALVASGDCFITLATKLDDLDKVLPGQGAALQPELERVIRTLLYLQRHYTISKKRPNYRQ